MSRQERIRADVSPLGPVTDLIPVHSGQRFRIYSGRLRDRQVCLKTPVSEPAGVAVRLSSVDVTIGSEMFVRGFNGTLASSGGEHREDAARLLSLLLLAEREIVDATAGAWNHSTMGLGVWREPDERDTRRTPDRSSMDALSPVLAMPWYEGERLADLRPEEQRALFPRLLPALWKALGCAYHGDLSPENIVIAADRSRFHLIDPGASVEYGSPCRTDADDRDGETMRRVVFISNAANYPLLAPFADDAWDAPEGGKASRLAGGVGLLGRLEALAALSRVECDLMAPRGSRIAVERTRPVASDLLALGIIYSRMLTRQEPFLGPGRLLERPVWEGELPGFSYYPRWTAGEVVPALERAREAIATGWLDSLLERPDVDAHERGLAAALLNLGPATYEELQSLVRP